MFNFVNAYSRLRLSSIIAALILSIVMGGQVDAANFSPTTTQELIDSINTANTNAEPDIINLVPDMLYTITGAETGVPFSDGNGNNGLPIILTDSGNSLTINGEGAVIERDPALFTNNPSNPCSGPGINFRIFQVNTGANLTLNNLSLQGGCELLGGGVRNNSGTFSLFSSTISSNAANDDGGGIHNNGVGTITNSTISGNESTNDGGGIYNAGGTLFVSNVTLADNLGRNIGGGAFIAGGTMNLKNTLVVGNMSLSADPNCTTQGGGSIGDQGGNISDNSTDDCTFAFNAGFATSTMLGPLQDNGGSVLTHALLEPVLTMNPAIDAAVDCSDQAANPIDNDERGVPRIFGTGCDIGAYEFLMSPPMFVEAEKLLASDRQGGDQLGWYVSISGDYAILGARSENAAQGAAYIYERDVMGMWNEVQKLTASDGVAGDQFGASVGVFDDTVFVGAPSNVGAGMDSGAVYVYVRDGLGVWNEEQKLIPSNFTGGEQYGISVDIDNDRAIVGAYQDDIGPLNAGSAYIYERIGGVWFEDQQIFHSGPESNDDFGINVAIQGDTALVGAPGKNNLPLINDGAAYVFVRDGLGVWNEEQKLSASDAVTSDNFGISVALSGDWAVIGSYLEEDPGGDSTGAAYVFLRDGLGVWNQTQKLTASDREDFDLFGFSVSISGDTIVVGNREDDDIEIDSGSAYIFKRDGSNIWNEVQKLTASDALEDARLGYRVSIDGDRVLLGARGDSEGGVAFFDAGAGYVYELGAKLFIAKQTMPMMGTGFEFLGTGFPSGCGLDGAFILNDFTFDFCTLLPNTYTVQETNSQNFALTEIECFESQSFSTNADSVTVDLFENEVALCLFTNEQFTLDVTLSGTGSGTVTSSPSGINCGADCTEPYPSGQMVDLTATPSGDSLFVQWTGDCSGTNAMVTVTMDMSKTCDAQFVLQQRTLTLNKAGNGVGTVTSAPAGIDCNEGCNSDTGDFDINSMVTLTAALGTNSLFTGWGGDCSAAGTDTMATVTMSEARTCTATFVLEQRTLTLNKAGNGVGTVTSAPAGIDCNEGCNSDTGDFDINSMVTLTAALGTNSLFTGWGGDCSAAGTDTMATVTMSDAMTCTATFVLEQRTLTLNKAGNGVGTVTSAPAGIDCNEGCNSDTGDFDINTMVTLTAALGTNSLFTGWGGDCSAAGTDTMATVTMSEARTCTATFVLEQRTLTLNKAGNGVGTVTSAPAGIDCNEGCNSDTGDFDINTMVTLTAALGTNSLFTGWGGDCSAAGTDTMATVTMSEARTCTATFVLEQRTLTLNKAGNGVGTVTSAPAGIDCNEGCNSDTGDFDINSMVTLTAALGTNSLFTGWGGDCSAAGTDTMATVTMSEARTCTATFVLEQRTLTLNKAGNGTGTVTSAPAGIDCNEGCNSDTGDFDINSMVTLTAAEAGDSDFSGWGGDCSAAGTDTMATVTMSEARTCTATFVLEQRTLTLNKAGNGVGTVTSAPAGIDCNEGCNSDTGDFDINSMVTLTAALGTNSLFAGWGGDCSAAGTDTMATVTMNQARTCTATFVLEQRTLTLNKAGNGVGTVTSAPAGIDCNEGCNTDTGDFDINSMVTLTASQGTDSLFIGWGGDCSAAGNNTMATVTMIDAMTCTATFVLEQRTLVLNKAGSGAGTVTSNPVGIDCNEGCNSDTGDFDANTMVTLSAVEAGDSVFVGWGGDCSAAGNDPMASVTMNAARTCTATFDINVFTLNINLSGDGSGNVSAPGIDCGNGGVDCSEMYTFGTMVTLVATPDGMSTFIGFTGDMDCEDGMVDITQNVTCTAIFDSQDPIVLNPIFPGFDDAINSITAERATPQGDVAFLWGIIPGTTIVNGNVCAGLELGIQSPRILAIAPVNDFGVSTYIFYIPFISDFEFAVQLQAVDISTCRASNVIAQVIRKD